MAGASDPQCSLLRSTAVRDQRKQAASRSAMPAASRRGPPPRWGGSAQCWPRWRRSPRRSCGKAREPSAIRHDENVGFAGTKHAFGHAAKDCSSTRPLLLRARTTRSAPTCAAAWTIALATEPPDARTTSPAPSHSNDRTNATSSARALSARLPQTALAGSARLARLRRLRCNANVTVFRRGTGGILP